MDLVAVNKDQQSHTHRQHHCGDPELNIRQNGPQHVRPAAPLATHTDLRLFLRLTLPFTKNYVIDRNVLLSSKTAQLSYRPSRLEIFFLEGIAWRRKVVDFSGNVSHEKVA
jgi:hypothetical protein